MKTKLYGALLYHQKILQEKSLNDRLTLGPSGADFAVDRPDWKSPYALISDGELHLEPPMAVTMSCGGSPELRVITAPEKCAFTESDWAIINLAPGLDFVVCYRNAKAGAVGLGTPILSLTEALESPAARLLVLSFALHSTLIFLASLSGDVEQTVEIRGPESRWVEMLSNVEEHTEKDDVKEDPIVIEDTDTVIIDQAMKDFDRPKVDDTDNKLANLDKVEKPVGIQAALSGAKLHDMQSLFGSSAGLGNAWDFMPETAEGDAFGTGAGFGAGLSGLGVPGGGGGGGGGYGMGIGGMGGGGGGSGSAKVSGPKKSGVSKKPKLAMEPPKQGNFCKESNIQDVVKKRANALRNCYEQQLLANPELSGKIIVFWKIGLDGKVTEASIKSSTMNNARVESCLTQAVRRLRFDKPDGGICVVEFPFVFTSSQ